MDADDYEWGREHDWGCTETDHSWVGPGRARGVDGTPYLICERCAATVPAPVVEPCRRLVLIDDPPEREEAPSP